MIRVLIVEDSLTIAAQLSAIIGASQGMKVVGCVGDGKSALEAVETLRPDVVTMDIHMPRMDGLEATRRIMESRPVPIVILSGTMRDQAAATFRAVEAGALCFVRRPAGILLPDSDSEVAALIQTLRLMSEVKVVRRWKKTVREVAPSAEAAVGGRPRIVAIGASTGGPQALRTIFSALSPDFSVPILVVQHIAPGFIQAFADWLQGNTNLPVRIAENGTIAAPGQIYIAPDDRHLGVSSDGSLRLSIAPPEHGLRPAVSCLFRSVGASFGGEALAILLTGMGADGAQELKALREMGATTIVQDRDSSIVHGMPGAAIALGAAGRVLAPEAIGALLAALR